METPSRWRWSGLGIPLLSDHKNVIEYQRMLQMQKFKNLIMPPLIWEEFPALTQCHLQESEQVETPESQSNMLRKKTHINRKSEILCQKYLK